MLTKSDIRKRAEEALEKSGTKSIPVNPEAVSEALGVEVRFFNEPKEGQSVLRSVAGYYDVRERKIYVNLNQSVSDKIFTIAHELGHHVMHQEYAASERYEVLLKFKSPDTSDAPDEEIEADNFALYLLMPEKQFEKYSKLLPDYADQADIFAVSTSHIASRNKLT